MKNNIKNNNNSGEIIIYAGANGETKIEVQMKDETVWLSQKQMAELFDKDRKTVTEHLRNIFKEGELEKNSVCRKSQHTAEDGNQRIQKISGQNSFSSRKSVFGEY